MFFLADGAVAVSVCGHHALGEALRQFVSCE
jgi:hypothetical protein